jgi:hypothetical protein
LPLGQRPHYLRDRQAAGYFACGSAAHPVADHKNPMLDGKSKGIFVGRAFAAAIGER